MYGPPTGPAQDALTAGFQAKYPGLQVDFTPLSAPESATRLITQVNAGQHLVDLYINSTSVQIPLMDANGLDPIQSYLVGPNDSSAAAWQGGQYDFGDDAGKYSLTMQYIAAPTLTYNPSFVSPDEITSYEDLLDPKWANKIGLLDPTVAGTGQAAITYLYATPGLGKDFIQKLFAQKPVLSRDDHQLVDWVVQGVYPLELSGSQTQAASFAAQGIPVHFLGAENMKEGGWTSSGAGAVAVLAQPPHPNATRVYLDYLLSEEGQASFAQSVGYVSLRTDVPVQGVEDIFVPKQGVSYLPIYKEKYVRLRGEMVDFLKPLVLS